MTLSQIRTGQKMIVHRGKNPMWSYASHSQVKPRSGQYLKASLDDWIPDYGPRRPSKFPMIQIILPRQTCCWGYTWTWTALEDRGSLLSLFSHSLLDVDKFFYCNKCKFGLPLAQLLGSFVQIIVFRHETSVQLPMVHTTHAIHPSVLKVFYQKIK